MKLKSIALVLGLIPTIAYGADLPVKAPAQTFLTGMYPYQTSGMIFGIYTEGTGGSVNATVPGVGSNSLTTTTAAVGATVGYAWGNKNSNYAYTLEGDFGVTNFNGNSMGLSLQGPLAFEQRATLFTPWTNLAAMLPNFPNLIGTVPPFPSLQPGVTASNLQMGFAVGVKEKDISTSFAGLTADKVWRIEPIIRLVAMEQLSNGTALRAYVEAAFPDKGKVFGPVPGVSTTLGTEYTAGVGVVF